MNILILGAAGFLGRALVPLLLNDPMVTSIKAITHRAALPQGWLGKKLSAQPVEEFFSEGSSNSSNYDVVLCLCGRTYSQTPDERVIKESNELLPIRIIDYCRNAGVKHLILASSINVLLSRFQKQGYSHYKKIAEDYLTSSGVPFTIFRPSWIFGHGDAGFINIISYMRRFKVVPVFGNGQKIEQPMHVQEAADFFYKATMSPPKNLTLEIGGLAPMTYNDLLLKIASSMQRKIWLLHLPLRPFTSLLGFLEQHGLGLSINSEQIMHLDTDLGVDNRIALQHYPVELRPIEEWLSIMRLK